MTTYLFAQWKEKKKNIEKAENLIRVSSGVILYLQKSKWHSLFSDILYSVMLSWKA